MNNRALIVSIASLKGGVGKTAITSLLARYFTEIEGKQVLVVDFDGRGGITSLFHHKSISEDMPTVVDLLQDVFKGINPTDTFSKAVIQTGLEKKYGWDDNGGSLFLLPCDPSLDDYLPYKDSYLLKDVLCNINFSEENIILIDSGADITNIKMSVAAADIIFLPLILGKQDVHPSIETIRAIVIEQSKNGSPYFGGIVLNQNGDTQWENTYIENYQQVLNKFIRRANFKCVDEKNLIRLKQSRIIKRGTHLCWSWREDIMNSAKEIAEIIHKFDNQKNGV
ncbi:MAG: ParA family protein [Candidatus Brocadiales bacterium]|nr:ParA family protein [Candidatus Brocadiales bacterium]